VKRNLTFVFITGLFLILSTISPLANAQTASTGIVLGNVTDPGGSSVPDAKVELINTATNEKREAVTNSAGQYILPYVAPGEYTLKVNKQGFRTTSSAALHVDVAKSYTMDFKLELGTVGQVVQVEATAQVELQTALPEQAAWHQTNKRSLLREPPALVVEKEKGLVLPNRPAHCTTEPIVPDDWPGQVDSVELPLVSVEEVILVDPVG